jgi:hypothetical protein
MMWINMVVLIVIESTTHWNICCHTLEHLIYAYCGVILAVDGRIMSHDMNEMITLLLSWIEHMHNL